MLYSQYSQLSIVICPLLALCRSTLENLQYGKRSTGITSASRATPFVTQGTMDYYHWKLQKGILCPERAAPTSSPSNSR